MTCTPVKQNVKMPEIRNPLPDLTTVHQDHQLADIQSDAHSFHDAYHGTLPAVSA
jgi:hypothetical protein